MEKIGGLFEKFKGKFAKHIHNLSVSIEVIKKYTGITYDIKNISISSSGILKIKSSQIEKNEVFIKKSRIIDEINKKTTGIKIQDIK